MSTCYIHMRFDTSLNIETRVMAYLEPSLKHLMPVDLTALEKAMSLQHPLVLLVIAAQIWEPIPLHTMMKSRPLREYLRKQSQSLAKSQATTGAVRSNTLTAAMTTGLREALKAASALLKSDTPDSKMYIYHLTILKEMGVARNLGLLTLARRLELVKELPDSAPENDDHLILGFQRQHSASAKSGLALCSRSCVQA